MWVLGIKSGFSEGAESTLTAEQSLVADDKLKLEQWAFLTVGWGSSFGLCPLSLTQPQQQAPQLSPFIL